MHKPDKFIPALYGGVIMGVVSAIPFVNLINCVCCAGVMLGGFLAVFFYKNNFTPDTPPLTAGDCLAVGALAGVLGAFVSVILSSVIVAVFGDVMKEFILRMFDEMTFDIPQEALEELRRAIEEAPEGAVSMLVDLFLSLLIYPVFGLLGGLIGYGIWKPAPAPVSGSMLQP